MKVLSILPILITWFTQITTAQLIWPGDVNNNGIVNEVDLLTLGKAFGASGSRRPNATTVWEGQEVAENWEGQFPNGLSYAYADCNGDGRIDETDVKVISENFGFRHSDIPFVPDVILPGVPGVSPAFEVLTKDLNIIPEKEKAIELGLGNMDIPVDSILGLSFLIKLDPAIFNPKATDFNVAGWLENEDQAVIKQTISAGRSAPGDFIVAYTVTNGIPISSSGNGLIGSITLNPSIFELDLPDLKVIIDSITMVDVNLNPIPVLGTQIDFTVPDSLQPNNTILTTTMCQGDTLDFNNQTLTTTGIYVDTLVNQYSLDSFIFLSLTVMDTFQTLLNETLCEGQMLTFNNQILHLAGTYRDTLIAANGCDSFIVLNLSVQDTFQTQLDVEICLGDQYFFNGQNINSTGTYRDTLQTISDCDSFLVLNLTVNDLIETQLNETICEGDQRFFNGQNFSVTGTYQETLFASNGCDSIVTLNLIVSDTIQTFLNTTLCEGNSILFNEQGLSSTGVYRDTLQGENGCDSFLILNLQILPAIETFLTQTICAGEQLLFNGNILNTSGVFKDTMHAANGCDSVITLTLTVADTFQTIFNTKICEGASLTFNGAVLSTSGTYYDTLTSIYGCDSILVLNLGVGDAYETNFETTICEGETYLFNNLTLTNSGTYQVGLIAQNGCDSLVTLNLTVGAIEQTLLTKSICAGENSFFNQQSLTTSGTYFDTLSTVHGCDSFIQLNLTVLPTYETIIDTTMCRGDTLRFLNFILTEETTYWTTFTAVDGCDSTVVLNITFDEAVITNMESTICAGDTLLFQGRALTLAGIYTDTLSSVLGCDSIITLTLNTDASCQTVGIEDVLLENIKIYPNPVNNYLQISSSEITIQSIQLVNVTGQVKFHRIYQKGAAPEQTELMLHHLLPGVYWVFIQTEYGLLQEKIVKF